MRVSILIMKLGKYQWRGFALAAFLAGLAADHTFAAGGTNELQYNRDIRPILSDNCFLCHGPDKNNRKAKLRLDVRDVAIEKGAIVPGKPQESELIARITTTNEDDVMPPSDSHKKLTAKQKKTLERWISEGAEYQPHWSYIVPVRTPAPKVKNSQWVKNEIDAFILAPLERQKIAPSPEADKRTLLRRLSQDLIGLPPTPAETELFLKDTSPKAYERQVDRLLASPHFGERMAVPWLDVVRFSDTVGYHGDQNQNIFPYRDYVINAFNQNKRFDQFTIEQIAGDLLPNATTEQKVATGFNRLNMMTREGGAQAKEYIAKYQADRVRTISGAWLGSTMACSECHDHKYDPFTAKDFYQMEAFFADVKQWGYYADARYSPNPDLRGFSNDHPFPPEIEVDSPYRQRRIARLRGEAAALAQTSANKLKTDAKARQSFDSWRASSLAFLEKQPTGWVAPTPKISLKLKTTNAAAATNFTIGADSTVVFDRATKENMTFRLPMTAGWVSAVRLEVTPQTVVADTAKKTKEQITTPAERKKAAQASKITVMAALKSANGGKETKLQFHYGDADRKQDRFFNGATILGVTSQWNVSPVDELQTGVWLLDKPIKVQAGDSLVINVSNPVFATARVSVSPFAAEDPLKTGGGEALQKALAKSSARKPNALVSEAYLLGTGWDASALTGMRKIFSEVRECRNGRAMTMVTESVKPLVTRVLPRGNWQDESGEVVAPAVPHFLPQPQAEGTNRLSRLDLARWLVSRENPLTARHVVNRQWKELFGRGLAPVVEDLGAQGESPSHPELLDWLAVDFMESGWDVKRMIKGMVMSATYRQSANLRPELRETDPNNRLLASQNPRRMEAEFVRDNALAIAGLLNLEMGGPSAYPYQPAGYYANLQFPNRDYYASTTDEQYRRGVYAHWQRTFLQPMMANFDAPAREECAASRIQSNTPQQALTLLNDPTFVESARVFAEKLLGAKAASDAERIDLAFNRALARPAKEKEKSSLLTFLAEQRAGKKDTGDNPEKFTSIGLAPTSKTDPKELAAWTQVCRVVLNLHETITRY